jgi:4-hydroxy-3-methylbut-2-enyl diphosphate reductase
VPDESAPGSVRIEKLLIASLRGFCAGVVRAIAVVERALELCDGTVYVRKEVIHNRYVVKELCRKGAVFVEEADEVPDGSWLIYSAHGVAPSVRETARRKRLRTIDATCPLVTKVHLEVAQFARRGYSIIFIGHRDHDETIGTFGEAPESIRVVGSKAEAETVQVPDANRVAYLTQTTLSVDETREIVDTLKRRFPQLEEPAKDDICYATQNRQDAVKALAEHVDVLLVLGAPNSSNSLRLCEVSEACRVPAHLIETAADIRLEWLAGARTVGLTASASAPEVLVQQVIEFARAHLGAPAVEELHTVTEAVHFMAPRELSAIVEERRGTTPAAQGN